MNELQTMTSKLLYDTKHIAIKLHYSSYAVRMYSTKHVVGHVVKWQNFKTTQSSNTEKFNRQVNFSIVVKIIY